MRVGYPYSKEAREKIGSFFRGKPKSAEHRLKISLSNKGKIPWHKGEGSMKRAGYIVSEETRKKIGASGIGRIPWNKGKSYTLRPLSEEHRRKIGASQKGKIITAETRQKISVSLRGRPGRKQTEGAKRKISEARKGKPLSVEHRRKISLIRTGSHHTEATCKKMAEDRRGEKSHLWKGGIYPKNLLIRCSAEYSKWRQSVFKRDDWTCKSCGAKGIQLNADHIKPFSTHPELRFDINNGRTLCEPCHRQTDTYGGRVFKKR